LRIKKSKEIAQRLERLPEYASANTVMFYLTYGSEVITQHLIRNAWKRGKTVVVPLVTGPRNMLAAKITSLDRLKRSDLGPLEPDREYCKIIPKNKIGLVVVPVICFNKAGNRIGYGKGFYDTWLKRFQIRKRVAIAYGCQLTKCVPSQKHDSRVGIVITEKETIRTKPR